MKRNQFDTVVHRLNASLIVLAFSLTQVAPAWAGPDLSRRTLRPQGAASLVIQAGLEEALNAGPMFTEFAPEATQAGLEEVVAAATARGWVQELDPRTGQETGFFRTPGGGTVAVATGTWMDVNLDNIAETALIHPTGVVMGSITRLEADAQVYGTVINAEVHRNALQRGILRTVAEGDDWDPKALGYKVPYSDEVLTELDGERVIKAVLGEGARVLSHAAEITNTHVASMDNEVGRTVLTEGTYLNTEVGEGNRHWTPVKATLTHFEPLVTVQTRDGLPAEFAEAWIARGRTFTDRTYNEAIMPDLYVWADTDAAGQVRYHVEEDLPSIGVSGHYKINASYDATMKAKEKNLTQIGGKESSIHAWIMELPGAIASAVSIIGLKHGPITDPVELLTHDKLTAPGGFVAVTNQVWGIQMAGSAQWDLSPSAQDPLWLYKQHPEAVWGMVNEAWEQEKRYAALLQARADRDGATFDRDAYLNQQAEKIAPWPVRMLQTAVVQATQKKETDSKRGGLYQQVLDDAPALIEQFALDPLPADLNGIPHNFSDAVQVADSLAEQSSLPSRDWVAGRFRRRPLWRDVDVQFFSAGVTDPEVEQQVLDTSDSTAVILGKNRLTGATQLGRGVVVINSNLHDVTVVGVSEADYAAGKRVWVINSQLQTASVGEGTSLTQVIAANLKVGQNSDLRLSRFDQVTLGNNSWSSRARAQNVILGDRAELEPEARVARTEGGRHVILGGIFEDGDVGDGYTMHHTGAMGFGVTARNVQIQATGQSVSSNTNHSDGAILGVPDGGRNQVILLGPIMTGANLRVNTRATSGRIEPVTIGFGAFVKDRLEAGEVVGNFQFSQGSGVDGKLDKDGEVSMVFDKVPGMPLRLLWSKQFAESSPEAKPSVAHAIPEALNVALTQYQTDTKLGFSDEQRKTAVARLQREVDERLWESTYKDGALELTRPRVWQGDEEGLNGVYVATAGLEEESETLTRVQAFEQLPVVMEAFRSFSGEIPFQSAVPGRTGVVVDLSAAPEQALAAPYLPAGSVVVLDSVATWLQVQQLTDRGTDHVTVFFAEEEGGYAQALNRAIGVWRGIDAIQIYSARSEREVRAAADVGGRSIPVNVVADLTTRQILINLGAVAGEALNLLLELIERSSRLIRYL